MRGSGYRRRYVGGWMGWLLLILVLWWLWTLL